MKRKKKVMRDEKNPFKIIGKIYKTIVTPAITHGSECWAVKKNRYTQTPR